MSKHYILCVDDDPLNNDLLGEILETDYELGFASDGQSCLDSIAIKKPDLVLLDINMPIMTGIQTCKILRKDEQYNDMPIIFISALASKQEKQVGLDSGANAYITKPFVLSEVLLTIENHLDPHDNSDEEYTSF